MMNLRRMLPVAALMLATPFLSAQSSPARSAPVTKAAASQNQNALDINTASPDQLMALPGIGEVYMKRIVDGRPYTAKNQLLTRGILPKGTYAGISDQIIAKHATK